MIVSEMLRRLRVVLRDSEEPYQISTDQLYLMLQSAYMDIQIKSKQWKFFHQRGKLFTTTLITDDYTIPNVRTIDYQSIYTIQDGTTARYPLCIKDYSTWVYEETTGVDYSGVPIYLIKLPNFNYKIEPLPTTPWSVYGDYWLIPAEFSGQSDEPIWAEEFHEIVLLKAMEVASMLKPDGREAKLITTQFVTRLPVLWRAFVNLYLPSAKGAGPLL